MPLHLAFYVGSKEPNSGSQIKGTPLLTELSPQSSYVNLGVSRNSLSALFFCLTYTACMLELEREGVQGGSDTGGNLGLIYERGHEAW